MSGEKKTSFSITEARANFSDILGRVTFAKERIIVKGHGGKRVAIVPIEDLEYLEKHHEKIAEPLLASKTIPPL